MKIKLGSVVIFFFFIFFNSYAQEDTSVVSKLLFPPSIVIINGKVTCDNLPLNDAIISIYKNDEYLDEFSTDYTGNFNFTLQKANSYLLVFSKKGYTSKRLFISTYGIPENTTITRGGLLIDLFKELEGLDVSILDEPNGKFFYIKSINNLEYDKVYTNKIRAQLEELQRQLKLKQKEIIDKERTDAINKTAKKETENSKSNEMQVNNKKEVEVKKREQIK